LATVQLGPLALPLNPLLMLLGWWIASWLSDRVLRPYPVSARRQGARTLLLAAGIGLVASRAGFVALAWPAYAQSLAGGSSPGGWIDTLLQIVQIRDGGWLPEAGLAAAVGVLLAGGWRYPLTRRPLALGASAGLAFWAMVSTVLGVHERPNLPAVTLVSLQGPHVQLHQQPGAPMVVNLWASWCPPCVTEMPVFAQAQQRHTGIRFVFVNQGESPEKVQQWLGRQPYRLDNVLLDPRQQVGEAIGSSALPTTLIIDAQGRMLERRIGPLTAASLEGRLRGLY
jgi:thiol-disulfide isomerase/thioredoxin